MKTHTPSVAPPKVPLNIFLMWPLFPPRDLKKGSPRPKGRMVYPLDRSLVSCKPPGNDICFWFEGKCSIVYAGVC